MIVLVVTATLRAPWSKSLKDKRSEVRRVLARLRGHLNVSACESHEQDVHRLIGVTVAALAFDPAQADSIAQSVERTIEAATEAEVIRLEV